MKTNYTWNNKKLSCVNGEVSIKLIRYKSLWDIFVSLWECPQEELMESEIEGVDEEGNERYMTFEAMYRNVEKSGCYAFVDTDNVIHFWVDTKTVDPSEFIEMMAHEKGHTMKPFHRDEMKEEIKAEAYAEAGRFAYDMYKDVFGKRK